MVDVRREIFLLRMLLARLEVLVLMAGLGLPLEAVRRQISRAVEIIVQVRRDPAGQRVISDIAEVAGDERPFARSLGLPCGWPEPTPGIFGTTENFEFDPLTLDGEIHEW